jgi:hypothetical protein
MTGFILSLVQFATAVTIIHAPCPAYAQPTSCYDPVVRTIYITPRDERSRYALLHEYGHAWDFDRLTDPQRKRIQRLLGYSSARRWWQAFPSRQTPAEAFADAYAFCAMGQWPRWALELSYRCICPLLPPSAYAVILKAQIPRTKAKRGRYVIETEPEFVSANERTSGPVALAPIGRSLTRRSSLRAEAPTIGKPPR